MKPKKTVTIKETGLVKIDRNQWESNKSFALIFSHPFVTTMSVEFNRIHLNWSKTVSFLRSIFFWIIFLLFQVLWTRSILNVQQNRNRKNVRSVRHWYSMENISIIFFCFYLFSLWTNCSSVSFEIASGKCYCATRIFLNIDFLVQFDWFLLISLSNISLFVFVFSLRLNVLEKKS